MVQVEINDEKCTIARECRKCMTACPEGIFMTYPRVGRQPGKEAENWAIKPIFLSSCTACKVCEEVCPQGAITVSVTV